MKKTKGINVAVGKDETGGFVRMHWICPYCDFDNSEFFFTELSDQLTSYFAVDRECQWCGKMACIHCKNASFDLFK